MSDSDLDIRISMHRRNLREATTKASGTCCIPRDQCKSPGAAASLLHENQTASTPHSGAVPQSGFGKAARLPTSMKKQKCYKSASFFARFSGHLGAEDKARPPFDRNGRLKKSGVLKRKSGVPENPS